METKDLVYIEDSEGNYLGFEIVTIYSVGNSKYNYIIYRNSEEKDYYIAKYMGDEISELDTNLTEEEIKVGRVILKGVIK